MLPIVHIARRPWSSGSLRGETLLLPYRSDATVAEFPAMWIMGPARAAQYSPDSVHTKLQHIIAVELWAIHRGIDLYNEMVCGRCITLDELADLNLFLHFRIADLRKLIDLLHFNRNDFMRKCLEERPVTGLTLAQRQLTSLSYLQWLGEHGNRLMQLNRANTENATASPLKYDSPDLTARRKLLEPSIKLDSHRYHTTPGSYAHYFKSVRPSKHDSRLRNSSTDPKATAEADRFALWVATLDYAQLKNDGRRTARRNFLMLTTLISTGIRAGELLQLKIKDFKPEVNQLHIERRHSDPEDPRSRQPVAKTQDRAIVISAELSAILQDYIVNDRDDIDAETDVRHRNPFLFVSLDRKPEVFGMPLSKTALDKVLKGAAKAAGVRSISSHPLRHYRARDLVRALKANGCSDEDIRRVLVYEFGWSRHTTMIELYLSGKAHKDAASVVESMWAERKQ